MKEKHLRRGKHAKNATGERSVPAVNGFKYGRLVSALLHALHEEGTERDRAGNRQLFYDQYATLLLLYFFTPTVTSLRGIQQRSELSEYSTASKAVASGERTESPVPTRGRLQVSARGGGSVDGLNRLL